MCIQNADVSEKLLLLGFDGSVTEVQSAIIVKFESNYSTCPQLISRNKKLNLHYVSSV